MWPSLQLVLEAGAFLVLTQIGLRTCRCVQTSCAALLRETGHGASLLGVSQLHPAQDPDELGIWLLNLLLCYCFRFVSCCRQNRVALPSWNLFDILPQASGALQSHGVIQLDDQMSNLACQNLQGKAVVQPKSYQQYTSRSAELATISRNRRHWCVHST